MTTPTPTPSPVGNSQHASQWAVMQRAREAALRAAIRAAQEAAARAAANELQQKAKKDEANSLPKKSCCAGRTALARKETFVMLNPDSISGSPAVNQQLMLKQQRGDWARVQKAYRFAIAHARNQTARLFSIDSECLRQGRNQTFTPAYFPYSECHWLRIIAGHQASLCHRPAHDGRVINQQRALSTLRPSSLEALYCSHACRPILDDSRSTKHARSTQLRASS